ncbi:DUF1343 domain-containing protein [Streptomyces tricolor]|nr:DUF1343 domain-containing protein [Streptomyces tricolor]
MHRGPRVELIWRSSAPSTASAAPRRRAAPRAATDDPATGLPVYDTYLKSGRPLADIFTASGVDTVVFDIQDVGARSYVHLDPGTTAWRQPSPAGKRFVVLDPPQPGDRTRPRGRCCTRSSPPSSAGSRSRRRTG